MSVHGAQYVDRFGVMQIEYGLNWAKLDKRTNTYQACEHIMFIFIETTKGKRYIIENLEIRHLPYFRSLEQASITQTCPIISLRIIR